MCVCPSQAVAASFSHSPLPVLQSLLTAKWPLELQNNSHSCIQQLQDVYLSVTNFGEVVGVAAAVDSHSKVVNDSTFLDLTQVGFSHETHVSAVLLCFAA